jgi:hypothetical protein
LGDGKVFRQAATTPLTTPDQRALLHFADGVERLVIETSVAGSGSNFAWVVPLPSEPKIEPVSTNFFRNLHATFQPRVVHEPSTLWMWILGLWGVIAASFALRTIMIAVLLMLASILAAPSLSTATAGGSSSPNPGVTILNRGTIGVFDTSVIKGTSGDPLLHWLNRAGFDVPAEALPVIHSYATQGWVFATAKLSRADTNATELRPHPLAFTFRSEKPVYPLRLTGIENGPCSMELYVFGPSRAKARDFDTEFCVAPRSQSSPAASQDGRSQPSFRRSSSFQLGNSEVRNFALPAPVATKLVATLSPRQMQSDAWIQWTSFGREIVPTVYTPTAASTRALDWLCAIACGSALGVQLFGRKIAAPAKARIAKGAVVCSLLAPTLFLWAVDVLPIELRRNSSIHAASTFYRLEGIIADMTFDGNKEEKPPTFEDVRKELIQYQAGRNAFTGDRLREGATPGDILLKRSTNGLMAYWHDYYGEPIPVAEFPRRPASAETRGAVQ